MLTVYYPAKAQPEREAKTRDWVKALQIAAHDLGYPSMDDVPDQKLFHLCAHAKVIESNTSA